MITDAKERERTVKYVELTLALQNAMVFLALAINEKNEGKRYRMKDNMQKLLGEVCSNLRDSYPDGSALQQEQTIRHVQLLLSYSITPGFDSLMNELYELLQKNLLPMAQPTVLTPKNIFIFTVHLLTEHVLLQIKNESMQKCLSTLENKRQRTGSLQGNKRERQSQHLTSSLTSEHPDHFSQYASSGLASVPQENKDSTSPSTPVVALLHLSQYRNTLLPSPSLSSASILQEHKVGDKQHEETEGKQEEQYEHSTAESGMKRKRK